MRKIFLLLTICCGLIACKKVTVDFTMSPEAPRAGQAVSFNNKSSSGEEWEWTFGDGTTSTLRSPSHIYKRPGTYRVSLKVDKKKSLMETKELTVYDTVPTFVASDSVFYVFKDYTFTANLYNPYNYTVSMEWECSDSLVRVADDVLTCYFTRVNDSAHVALRLTVNGETTSIEKKFFINDRKTNSIALRTAEGYYRQRIFGDRAEKAKLDESAKALLDAEQDTMQTYNGHDFTLSEINTVFPEVKGFHIANRKIYYRANGLLVANIDGTNIVQIDTADCLYMTLDTHDNRIYWANAQGVWFMPFVGSDNNKFVSQPQILNTMNNVTKLAADAEAK